MEEEVYIKIKVKTTKNPDWNNWNVPKDKSFKTPCVVLRWNSPAGRHAVYAQEYDPTTRIFTCLNSWGSNDPPKKIHANEIYAYDQISYDLIQSTKLNQAQPARKWNNSVPSSFWKK